MKRLLLLVGFGIVAMADTTDVPFPETLRSQTAIAQRNYLSAKIQYDEAAKTLTEIVNKGSDFCKGKSKEYDGVSIACVDKK